MTTAEYVLRRALFDTGRILTATRSALSLGPAEEIAENSPSDDPTAPFVSRLRQIESVRQLSGASQAIECT